MRHAAIAIVAGSLAAFVSSPSAVDQEVARGSALASKKGLAPQPHAAPRPKGLIPEANAATESPTPQAPPVEHGAEPTPYPALLATLVQTHTNELLPLDAARPSAARFSALLADRVTGERRTFDPRLLELLRSLAAAHPTSRIELVSGYRSPKLNEMLRKKGRRVASHSQHSLGHAVDFRIVLPGERRGIDPRDLEKEIRALGWKGGVGVYTLTTDWFVHTDVGRERRWGG